jgi:hypothetical protein
MKGIMPSTLMAENLASMIVLMFPDTKYRSNVWFRLSDKIDSVKNCNGKQMLTIYAST